MTLSITDDTRRVDNTQKVLLTAIVSFVSSSNATQQDIDDELKKSFTGFDALNYVDLLRQSTDSILSSAIDVVYIVEASMYPSQVPLCITSSAPSYIEAINTSIQSSMFGLDMVLGVNTPQSTDSARW